MIYDGRCQAIRNLRKRKKLSQKDVEKVGGIATGTVSKWEREERIPTDTKLSDIIKGLRSTEIEFWEEKVSAERKHYQQRAIELGERLPAYNVSVIGDQLNRLLELDMENVSAESRNEMNELRNHLVATITSMYTVIDRYDALWKKEALAKK